MDTGGLTPAAPDTELLACLHERINWLTDNRNIGYGEWLDDPSVFLERAGEWKERGVDSGYRLARRGSLRPGLSGPLLANGGTRRQRGLAGALGLRPSYGCSVRPSLRIRAKAQA